MAKKNATKKSGSAVPEPGSNSSVSSSSSKSTMKKPLTAPSRQIATLPTEDVMAQDAGTASMSAMESFLHEEHKTSQEKISSLSSQISRHRGKWHKKEIELIKTCKDLESENRILKLEIQKRNIFSIINTIGSLDLALMGILSPMLPKGNYLCFLMIGIGAGVVCVAISLIYTFFLQPSFIPQKNDGNSALPNG